MRSGVRTEVSLEGPEGLPTQWLASAPLPDTCVHSCVGAEQRAGLRLETRSHLAVREASFSSFPLCLTAWSSSTYSFPEISGAPPKFLSFDRKRGKIDYKHCSTEIKLGEARARAVPK